MPFDFKPQDNKPHHSEGLVLPIYSVTPFTMLDFPDKCAAIIWFSGCNMRCGYCHNPQIVKGKGKQDINSILNFLEKRRGLLDAVVLSGGEASVYPDLPNLVRRIKEMGFAIKLDTNGLRPDRVRLFLEEGLLDYVALDYKAPPTKFKAVTGVEKFQDFEKTLAMLCAQSSVDFEVRTTVHSALMDEADIADIITDLEGRAYTGSYYIQNYINNDDAPTLGMLGAQAREIDIQSFPQAKGFDLEFRNFNQSKSEVITLD